MEWIVAAVVFSWVTLVIVGLLCYRLTVGLLRQNGKILLTIERHEKSLVERWRPAVLGESASVSDGGLQGLSPGTAAPAFALPTLRDAAQHLGLEELRGKKLLLVFFGSSCGHCDDLAPKLARLPFGGKAGYPELVVITNGTPEDNEKFVTDYELRCPVLVSDDAVYLAYGASATPVGYLVDEQGIVASNLLVGGDAILKAARPENLKGDGGNGRHLPSSVGETVVVARSS